MATITHRGLSGSTRRMTAVIALLVLLGAGAALWLSGVATAAYQWGYVALAYPVAWTLGTYNHLRGRAHAPIGWGAWVGHAATRYPALQGKPYHTLVLIEAAALLLLALGLGWRVVWFVCTRPGHIQAGATHGDAHLATPRELRALRDRGGPLLLGRLGRRGMRVCLDQAMQALNILVVGPPGSGKSAGVIIPNLLRERGDRSLVCTDLKGELLRLCGRALAATHTVWSVNFLAPDTSLGYNPLAGCTTPMYYNDGFFQ